MTKDVGMACQEVCKQGRDDTSGLIYHCGASLSEQHTDLLVYKAGFVTHK